MKELVGKEFEIGSDGKGKAHVSVDSQSLIVGVEASYPIVKIIEPATKAVDDLLDKLEKLIPGDWDKPHIEKLKEEYKEKLIEYLTK